ncbi:NUDIX domain-containing protein [Georgenia sp. H159]|uniref:NUDIX domain-containing protein n=1 Tax=Georgenia sp. H159 TaxID=3076115 RepID=UPI002D778C7F|nr:NUDIX domain-containing protein [Georgenia sp. H159]
MADVLPPDPRPPRRPGDGWVECRCGQRHWGRYGAAGLLLWRRSPQAPDGTGTPLAADATDPSRYAVVLQHRALWSHHGGTWGLPGGAVDPGETAVQGALREAQEEADLPPSGLRVRTSYLLDHGDWSYATVVAEAVAQVEPRVSDAESVGVAWVEGSAVTERQLLPAFADALPGLRALLGRRLVLVVDGANTMGSRPDGWWRDRAAASERLRDELAVRATDGLAAERLGLPGHRWYPDVVLVTEGRGRGPVGVAGADGVGGVAVVGAPGPGDDEIVAQAERHVTAGADVVVVTADRELRRRVEALGAATAGPGLVLR